MTKEKTNLIKKQKRKGLQQLRAHNVPTKD